MSIVTRIRQVLTSLSGRADNGQTMDFSRIYKKGEFKGRESKSGEGSGTDQTRVIRSVLPELLKKYKIKSMMDAPCGDFFWMRFVNLMNIDYLGVDIVPEAIERNNTQFTQDGKRFQVMDVIAVKPPKVDMIFCRDLLVHLSLDDARKVIGNFKDSGSEYLLTTTFTDRQSNEYDIKIKTGQVFWRPLNLERPPFSFGTPIEMINEGCTEGDGQFSDKSLGLWRLADIRL